jgi:mannose-1-phosphate guanylyltransferase
VDVSLHLVEVEDARAFGCVPTDAAGRVTGFTEKSDHPVTNQVNAGCYVFRRRVVDLIPQGRVVSVERETFPGLVASGALVVGYVESAYWRDVGTPSALVAASRDLVLGTAPSPAMPARGDGALVDPSADVATTARVGDGSVVVRDASVGAGSVVQGSVLMAGSSVRAGSVVVESVVGPGAVVGEGVRLEGVTVGDGAVLRAGTVLERGARVDCAAVLPG